MPGRGTAHSTEDLFLSCQTTTPYCVPLCALCVRVNSKVEHAVPLPGTLATCDHSTYTLPATTKRGQTQTSHRSILTLCSPPSLEKRTGRERMDC